MTDYEPQGSGTATARGHEGADLSARKIAVTTTLLILFLAATHFGLKEVMDQFATHEGDKSGTNGTVPLAVGAQIPPAPRLQANPVEELDALKTKQRKLLESYRWMDAAHTSAHIPIERAETLLLQHGLPSLESSDALSPAAPKAEKQSSDVR